MKGKGPASVYKTDAFSIKLAVDQLPRLTVSQFANIVTFGVKNSYPSKLLFWFNNHAEHGAIVKGKARYISGLQLETTSTDPRVLQFLAKANKKESWHQLRKKLDFDEVLSGGYFLKVTTNALGVPVEFCHLDFAKCRISPCHKFVLYCQDWDRAQQNTPVTIPMYEQGIVGTSVYVYKSYAPTKSKLESTYAQPEYVSCTLDIDTDVRVSTFFNSLVKNNFSAGNIVTIFNGETDKDKQAKVHEKLKINHEGEDNAGKTVLIFTTKDGKGSEVTTLNSNDLDKQYQEVSKRNQQKILSGHNVNGILFKIKTEGQLGGRTEIVEAHELFINEYAKVKQVHLNETINMFCQLKTGINPDVQVEQINPIGLEIPIDNQNVVNTLNTKDPNILFNYLVEKYNVKTDTIDASGKVVPLASSNDSLKGLSAAQHSDVMRIVRDYQRGKSGMNEAMALSRIMAYGVSSEEAKKWLAIPEQVQQSEDKSSKFFALFNKYAHEINFEDEVISTEYVNFKGPLDVLKFEQVKLKDYIADDNKDLRKNILTQIKGNPTISVNDLVKILKTDSETIQQSIDYLLTNGLLDGKSGGFTPTDKGLDVSNDGFKTEIYTEYVYTKRPDVSGDTIIPTTRQFCKDLVNQTKSKALKFEQIQLLENEFGENVWDFRGGFYNDGKETTPWCRHVWSAVTKIRRVK